MTNAVGQSDRDAVLASTDLVELIGEHVVLRRQGREHVGLCPFHDDRSPSMHVVTHKGTAFYKCFACGASGTAIDFAMEFHRMAFGDALRFLAERAHLTLSGPTRPRRAGDVDRSAILDANTSAMRFFRRILTNGQSEDAPEQSAGRQAAAVLAGRGVSPDMAEAFQLGAAADRWDALAEIVERRQANRAAFVAAGLLKARSSGDGVYDTFRNRLVFPICDELGRPVAFGARKLNPDDEPKYLNSPESEVFSKSRTLYGLHLARKAILDSGTVVVTEGYTDVIACHQAGFTNVVATLGTALTREHARLLKRLCETVVLVFDGDEAGLKAADRAVEVFLAEPVDVRICTLPDGLDPDELLRTEDGPARFRDALDQAVDALTSMVRRFSLELGAATSLSGRQQRLESMLTHLASLGFGQVSGVRKRLVLTALADLTRLPLDEIERALPAGTGRRPAAGTSDDASAARPSDPASVPASAPEPEPDLPRYLLEAERAFLALLLAHPEVLDDGVLDGGVLDGGVLDGGVLDGGVTPAPGTVSPAPTDLHSPAHRRIAEAVVTRRQTGSSLELPYLLDDFRQLARPDLGDLASALYLTGHRRTGGDDALARSILEQATLDLTAARRRWTCRTATLDAGPTTTDDDLSTVIQKLEALRERGSDPTAIARTVRS